MNKLLFLLFTVCLFTSCRFKTGSGTFVTEKRDLPSFTGITIGGDFEVEIRKGAGEVVIEADDNLIRDIETTVVNGQLRIRYDRNISLHDAHMKIFISAPEINNIKASASAEVVVKDKLSSTQKISLQSSSGATITASVDAPEVVAGSSSGADLILNGRTRSLSADASSGSSIKASELMSENTIAETSSGASVHVHASISLKASASSGGEVTYRGGGSVSKSESSGGSVNAGN